MARRPGEGSGSLFPDATPRGAGEPRPPRPDAPLADRMRPRTLDELLGQDETLGEGRPLRRALEEDR
ncbi:MAG TPA: recombination factor protein RarA, partial [Vicinamibacteria bacterium]|nr:recombination factor protein RarA [Vicinamibacteria bacterium]